MGEQPFPPGWGQQWMAEHVFTAVEGPLFWAAVLGAVVGFVLFLVLLQSLGSGTRRRLTAVCTFIAGLFYLFAFFIPPAYNGLKAYEQPLGTFLLVVGGFTIGLGVINLVFVHGRRITQARPGWINSAAFFLGFGGMAVFGIWSMYDTPVEAGESLPFATAVYEVLFQGLLVPLQATTFALLGFFIVSAAYRAFRIRSTEAALMTVIAFIVMLGQVPVGQLLTAWIPIDGPLGWLRLEQIANWLLTTPNTAAFRGIIFGSAVGGFALSLRVWLSLERGSYFGKEF